MDGCIRTVEQPHLIRLQSRSATTLQQIAYHRFTQPVVLRINGDLFSTEVAQRLGHQRAGADGVFVEIEAQHRTPAFQRSAVGLELLHSRACRWRGGAIGDRHHNITEQAD